MISEKVIALILVICLSAVLPGCIENPQPTDLIQGFVNNAHTETVRVDVYRESNIENEITQKEKSVRVRTGEQVKISLPPGIYDIEAYIAESFDSREVFIGSVEFRLLPNAVDFYITVFNHKVTARSNY